MTGFDRPNRSFYLDDMRVRPGDTVVCRSDMAGTFTPGDTYKVLPGQRLQDDFGSVVVPSARFTYGDCSYAL